MTADVELLDGAVPLVRGDQPWEWFANFWDDVGETTPSDLTGKTVAAEIRWPHGSQIVTATIYDAPMGQVRLSLLAAQTAAMPLGRLSRLYIAIDTDTEAVVPVDVIEGLFGAVAPVEPPPETSLPVHVITPASGDIVVLTDGRPVYVDTGLLASLYIRLPLGAVAPLAIEISFRSPVTLLSVQDGAGVPVPGGPVNAYGPGSSLTFEYVDETRRWVYWS